MLFLFPVDGGDDLAVLLGAALEFLEGTRVFLGFRAEVGVVAVAHAHLVQHGVKLTLIPLVKEPVASGIAVSTLE